MKSMTKLAALGVVAGRAPGGGGRAATQGGE